MAEVIREVYRTVRNQEPPQNPLWAIARDAMLYWDEAKIGREKSIEFLFRVLDVDFPDERINRVMFRVVRDKIFKIWPFEKEDITLAEMLEERYRELSRRDHR